MPFTEVPGKFKRGTLHSGSDSGPVVKKRSQMQAIMMSEKRRGTHEPSGSARERGQKKTKPRGFMSIPYKKK